MDSFPQKAFLSSGLAKACTWEREDTFRAVNDDWKLQPEVGSLFLCQQITMKTGKYF